MDQNLSNSVYSLLVYLNNIYDLYYIVIDTFFFGYSYLQLKLNFLTFNITKTQIFHEIKIYLYNVLRT